MNPVLYKREEAEACWRAIEAPMLMLIGEKSEYRARLGADGSDGAFRSLVPDIEIVHIAGAGHMLHIEKAALIAPPIEQFLEAN